MRWTGLLLLLTCFLAAALACTEDRPPPTPTATALPRVDGTVLSGIDGSTNPFTVNARPNPPVGVAVLKDVRLGSHPEDGGWDRIVFEFEDDMPGAEIEYVTELVGCGSGLPLQLAGRAFLLISFYPAQAHDDAGHPTVRSRQLSGPGNSILEAKANCDYEAEVAWGLGLRKVTNFKVTTLANPTRLVVDVRWDR